MLSGYCIGDWQYDIFMGEILLVFALVVLDCLSDLVGIINVVLCMPVQR